MTEARAMAAAIVIASPHLRLTDLALLLGRDILALGKAAWRVFQDDDQRTMVEAVVEGLRASPEYRKL